MELQHDWNDVRQRLHGFILRRIEDRDDAEDVLQDVLVKMHGSLSDIRDQSRVQAWAYQITRNVITDYYRRLHSRSGRSNTLGDPEALVAEPEFPDAERELAACLEPMIGRLPEHYREALVLADLEGVTQREVAERLGITLSGAKSRVQRSREKLREMLHECCTFELDRQGTVVGFRPRCETSEPCDPERAADCRDS
jgi:RNA polymerase sigma-70 factor, ECF subfamily